MEVNILHRREAIILTAIEVINEFGIQGLSTREVARRQGISEATIFKYFRTKNELKLAIIDHYSQYDADIMESIELKGLKSVEAILYMINAYAEYYQSYPQITAIMQAYDVLSYDPELANKIKGIFLTRNKFMEGLIAEAQKSGEISKNVECEKLTDTIWGSFCGVCLKWRLGGCDFPLKDYIMETLEMIINAFSLL